MSVLQLKLSVSIQTEFQEGAGSFSLTQNAVDTELEKGLSTSFGLWVDKKLSEL